jgi:hypothetical protein
LYAAGASVISASIGVCIGLTRSERIRLARHIKQRFSPLRAIPLADGKEIGKFSGRIEEVHSP